VLPIGVVVMVAGMSFLLHHFDVNIPWVKGVLEDTVWVSSPGEKRDVTDAVCAAIQETTEEKGIDMPNPTYALENTIRFSPEDADRVSGAIGEATEDLAAQPTA
jgi:hypothetical protein